MRHQRRQSFLARGGKRNAIVTRRRDDMGWGPWGMRTARRCKQGEKCRERYPGGFSAIPWNWQKRRCRQVCRRRGGGQVQGRMHVARGREGVRRMYPRTGPASCMYRPPYRVPSTWAKT